VAENYRKQEISTALWAFVAWKGTFTKLLMLLAV